MRQKMLLTLKLLLNMNKFITAIILLFIGIHTSLSAQYKFAAQLPSPVLEISNEEVMDGVRGEVMYEREDNVLNVLSVKVLLDKTEFELKQYDLDSEELIGQHSYYLNESINRVKDFYYDFDLRALYLLIPYNLIVFKDSTPDIAKVIDLNHPYSHMSKLKDNLLFYRAYPAHPMDGKHDIYFLKYNISKQELSDEKYLPIEGVVFGNAMNRWIRVINDEIYITSPFSGVIHVYDDSFKKLRDLEIKIEGLNEPNTLSFLDQFNQRFQAETSRLLKEDVYLKEKYGEDYLLDEEKLMKDKKMFKEVEKRISSDYFSKSEIDYRMRALQSNHSYIEKLLPYDVETFIISIWRPENGWAYRDLYFIDNKTGKVNKTIKKWGNHPDEKLEEYQALEDFFVVPISYSRSKEAIFYKNNAWVDLNFPIEVFESGEKKRVDKNIYQWTRKNGKQWIMSKYIIED